MNHVTTEFGRRTNLKAIPSKTPPMNLERFLREHGEERLGQMMRATVAPRVEPREYTHKRTLRERICDFLAENGPSTTREIIEGTGISKGSASPTVAVMHRAGQIQPVETGAGCHGNVWSLVEGEG